jgi:hypothetical protein
MGDEGRLPRLSDCTCSHSVLPLQRSPCKQTNAQPVLITTVAVTQTLRHNRPSALHVRVETARKLTEAAHQQPATQTPHLPLMQLGWEPPSTTIVAGDSEPTVGPRLQLGPHLHSLCTVGGAVQSRTRSTLQLSRAMSAYV